MPNPIELQIKTVETIIEERNGIIKGLLPATLASLVLTALVIGNFKDQFLGKFSLSAITVFLGIFTLASVVIKRDRKKELEVLKEKLIFAVDCSIDDNIYSLPNNTLQKTPENK